MTKKTTAFLLSGIVSAVLSTASIVADSESQFFVYAPGFWFAICASISLIVIKDRPFQTVPSRILRNLVWIAISTGAYFAAFYTAFSLAILLGEKLNVAGFAIAGFASGLVGAALVIFAYKSVLAEDRTFSFKRFIRIAFPSAVIGALWVTAFSFLVEWMSDDSIIAYLIYFSLYILWQPTVLFLLASDDDDQQIS